MSRHHTNLLCLIFTLISAFLLSHANAVVYSYDSGTTTTTYKTTEPTSSDIANWTTGWGTTSGGAAVTGWDYVGTINGASGVYLGNGWVIACGHEGVGVGSIYTITINGVTSSYNVTSVSSIGGTADLVLFQIDTILDLPSLTINPATPTIGTSITMIGYGGGTQSWGTDSIEHTSFSVSVSGYTTTDFYTLSQNGVDSYAITGDSGGAAFTYNSSTHSWMLTGIMEAVGTSGSTNVTYYAQLSDYYGVITSTISAIPEDSPLALLATGGILFLAASFLRKKLAHTH